MARQFQGQVEMDIRDSVADWEPFLQPQAPAEAPNVLWIVWDDVGYGAMDVFGGPIETPTMRRIADMGLRYSNFHTTALCSPTRSCLLTGRNATSNNMACITEATSGFPGYSGRVPFENGMISEVLSQQGWNTYLVGKWHLTPAEESDMSAWKGRWPLGRGFERFYGFLGAETHQWYPDLIHDNHPEEAPATPEEGYHFSKDITDKAIRFIRDAKAVAPQKPFFLYYSPGCAHAPHHVFKEWADRYQGRFDEGYEAIRPSILARQKELGLLPAGTELSVINPHGEPDGITGPAGQAWPQLDWVRPWDSLTDEERRLFVRMAEVYAGFVSYTDDQIGRLIDLLAELGQLDNTVIMVTSDNGASGEGGPNGSFNENKLFNGQPDTIEANLARIDELGGPTTYNHYNTGWAWAFDTPFPYWKRFAGYEGGLSDPLIVAWPQGIEARGEVRHQYIHAIDLVPTVYEMFGITPPDVLNGYTQSAIEGRSFADSFTDPNVPGRAVQFYGMLGMRAIYRDGWLANTLHPPISGWANYEQDRWELYNLSEDRAQHRDVAAEHPQLLEQLKGLWHFYAGKYNGLPLDDRSPLEIFATPRPQPTPPRTRYVYYPDSAEVPEPVSPNIRRRSYTIAAGVYIGDPDAAGVLFKEGSAVGGHTLFVKDHRLHYVNNWLGEFEQMVSSEKEVGAGRHVLTAEFAKTGDDPQTMSALGTLTLYIDTDVVGAGQIRTQPGNFGIGGGLVVGRNPGSPVTTAYARPDGFPFTGGTIERVIVDVSGEEFVDHEAEVLAWLLKD